MILLKDGVKYILHSYGSEEELENMVIEHYREIFGKNSLYFDKETMRTRAGVEARNDGIIISFDENKWFILEVELSAHSLYDHIVPQITKFSNAYRSHGTRKKITNALYHVIKSDLTKTAIIRSEEIEDEYKFLTDLIDSQPTITIIIDSKTDELDEVCNILPFSTRIIEFKTFARENVGLKVHIHEFEPLFREKISPIVREKEEFRVQPSGVRKMPKTLEEILAVVKLMQEGSSYIEAVKVVAKQHNIDETTVRDKCTRQPNLNTQQFNVIVKDRYRLISLLQQRFPNYRSLIINELGALV